MAGCAVLLSAACSGTRLPELDLHAHLEAAGRRPIDVRVLLQPEHRRDGDRYLRGATAALNTCRDWMGPLPRTVWTLVDPPWRTTPETPAGAVLLDRTPWWSARTSMLPELAAARAVTRQFLHERIDTAALPPGFVDGLAEYVARRAMLPLFEIDNTAPGYAFLEERFIGGFIPRFVRIRLLIETDGEPATSYRANRRVAMSDAAGAAGDARTLAGKMLLTLGTLERWVGRPVFDAMLAEFARQSTGEEPTLERFADVASSVSGQRLSWLFDEAFGSARVFDYGVGALISNRGADGLFETEVLARRIGDAQFTGASAPPIGPFESGGGMALRVTFEDGGQVTDAWDGRGREKTFRYRSASRAVSAAVDPDRVLLLDVEQTNNGLTLAPHSAAAASRWGLLWLGWLEHALLTYGMLL